MKSINKKNIKKMFDLFYVILIILSIMFIQNIFLNAIHLILLSTVVFIRVRKIKVLMLIVGVITYVNLSIAIVDVFIGYEIFPFYQHEIRNSIAHEILINSTLIIMIILFLYLSTNTINKIKSIKIPHSKNNISNPIVFLFLTLYILIALIFGFERNITTYGTNSSTLYEYSLFVFILLWFNIGKNNYLKILFYFLACIFILQGLYYGDRTSGLVLLIIILAFNIKKISITKLILGLILIVLIGNFISTYRDSSHFTLKILFSLNTYYKGPFTFFLDTSSWSYYSGLTIVSAKLNLVNTSKFLYEFILSIFLGNGGAFTRNADITIFVSSLYPNSGGGFYPSYFYFFGGYIGVIIGGIILANFLKFIFLKSSQYYIIFQYIVFSMSFRWYIYTPINLFRSVFLIFPIMYFSVIIINKLLKILKKGV